MRNFLCCLLFLIPLLMPLSACYHLRAEPVPISARVVEVKADPAEVLVKLRKLVEVDWKSRILETDSSGTVLITAPYHFHTDTGFGQPAGGRKYYTQLRIEILPRPAGLTAISLSPHNFEMRTSYAFSQEGQIGTLYKHYPYEHYPGMFDLSRINSELMRVAARVRSLFQ